MATDSFEDILRKGALSYNLSLSDHQIDLFVRYKEEIQSWNKRLNLTRVDDDEGIAISHFLDSLVALSVGIGEGSSVIDVGAGAGLPGIALKIAREDLDVVLVESIEKKANFIRHVISELGLDRISVIADRAEVIAHDEVFRESFDIAFARALSSLPVLMEYLLPLVKTGGRVVAYKGEQVFQEIAGGEKSALILGGRIEDVKPAVVPFLEAKRYLIIVKKEAQTDMKYPRRVGIPTKRPLGQV